MNAISSTWEAGVSDFNPTFAEAAPTLVAKGYTPIPITLPTEQGRKAGKRPCQVGWEQTKPGDIAALVEQFPDKGVGLLLGDGLICVDVDFAAGSHTDNLRKTLVDWFGAAPYRVGSKGFAMLFRCTDGFDKKQIFNGRERGNIEVLSLGQQVVIFGTHPTTCKPYEWFDGNPLEVPPASLPLVNAERLTTLLNIYTDNYEDEEEEAKPNVNDDNRLSDLNKVLTGCAFLQHCKDDAITLSENEWYAALSIVARCDDGEDAAHEWSKPHPKYTKKETEDKITRALAKSGPRTCRNIYEKLGFKGCRKCPNEGRVKSPIVLGLPPKVNAKKGVEVAPDVLAGLVERYVYDACGENFYDLKCRKFFKPSALAALHAHDQDATDKVLLKSKMLPKVMGVTCDPTGDLVVHEGGADLLNLFRPSDVIPAFGDVSIFLNHAAYIIPDEVARNHVLNWMAYLAQNPGRKINHALLIVGVQGTGKSYFGKVMELVLGRHNVASPDNDALHGRFNEYLTGRLLIVVHELMARGRLELYNKVKSWITEDSIQIEPKHVNSYFIKNIFNTMTFSNFTDAIVIPDDDRRFFVYGSPARKMDEDYYLTRISHMTQGFRDEIA